MGKFILRLIVNAIALYAAASFVGGIGMSSSLMGVLFVAAIFGLVNAIIKPVVMVLSLPFQIVTLGLFTLIINAGMLALTGAITSLLVVDSFGAALLGGLVISIVSFLLSVFLIDEPKHEVYA